MSRIYDALKRAAGQARDREVPAAAPTAAEGVPPRPQDASRPTGMPPPPPTPSPGPAAKASPRDPRWESLKAQVADQIRVDTWMRLEASALQQLRLGRLPRSGGVSGWLLEAIGGVALGFFTGSVSLLLIFVILVWLMHIRIPQLFW